MGAGVMSSGGLGTGEVKMKDHNDEPKKLQGANHLLILINQQ